MLVFFFFFFLGGVYPKNNLGLAHFFFCGFYPKKNLGLAHFFLWVLPQEELGFGPLFFLSNILHILHGGSYFMCTLVKDCPL